MLSVYLDRTDDVTVRLAAFTVLRDSRPSDALLQRIGLSLAGEPSAQISAFVYTSLIAMSGMGERCEQLRKTSVRDWFTYILFHWFVLFKLGGTAKNVRQKSQRFIYTNLVYKYFIKFVCFIYKELQKAWGSQSEI